MLSVARPLVRAVALASALCASGTAAAQTADSARAALAPPVPIRATSAPIRNVRYEVAFDDTLALRRTLKVNMTFEVAGPGPVVLSLPAWTPGAYEISNFARFVSEFRAVSTGARATPLDWDRLDHDSWRVQPAGAREIAVSFDYLATQFDNAGAWSRPDFVFFNGTNVFFYPEGRGFAWDATVTVRTRADWRIGTGMPPVPGAARTWRASNYHDLVDFPFFVGRLDLDSARIADRWFRMVTYPSNALTAPVRAEIWRQLKAITPPSVALFGDVPFDTYTLLQVVDPQIGGASGLEHQNSQLDIISPLGLGSLDFSTFLAHEVVHAWNVKRLRPADMVPYVYDAPQPTTWLWVSEGLTDYYGNLTTVRGGLIGAEGFYALVTGQMADVERNTPVSLEDASLAAWVSPTAFDPSIYYSKGALAGLAIDILVRDGSNNRFSLDDVVRELYRTTYHRGRRGFTEADWWTTVSRAAGGRSFEDFRRRYIDGRDEFPWDSILPKAGMLFAQDTIREPRMSVTTVQDTGGVRVVGVVTGGMADEAGIRVGDFLVRVGEVAVENPEWGTPWRAAYARRGGERIQIVVRRNGEPVTLSAPVRMFTRTISRVTADPRAGARALRIREGMFRGTTEGGTR